MYDEHSIVLVLHENDYLGVENLARMFRSLGLVNTISTVTSTDPPSSRLTGSNKIDGA